MGSKLGRAVSEEAGIKLGLRCRRKFLFPWKLLCEMLCLDSLHTLHLVWKSRLLLRVEVTWRVQTLQTRARCRIPTNETENSKDSDGLNLENIVPPSNVLNRSHDISLSRRV